MYDVIRYRELNAVQPAGYHGSYDIEVLGIHHIVDMYYYVLPDQQQFYTKTHGSGVDIPWYASC